MPEPVEDGGGAPGSNGLEDAGVVRRVGPEVAEGDGRPDPTGGLADRGGGQGLVDFTIPALTTRLDAAQRVAAAGSSERERIGQDLHDGVQQRLTALRIRLALAAEDFEARGDADASTVLNEFGDDVEEAIDELREFAQGVYPVLLTSRGLGAALVSAGRRVSQPVTVLASGVRRYPSGIETAVYFCCLAALDNAAKHAGASDVTVRLWGQAQGLCFTIRDTGHGFDSHRMAAGAGITNMRDRIAAVGGTLTIDSTPAGGTIVQGSVPNPG
jgi:signal transduction histidine kinase